MPELPEVETIRSDLQQLVVGEKILELECLFAGSITCDSITAFRKDLLGQEIKKVERRGKYLLLHLSNKQILVIHLRMTGQLIVKQKINRSNDQDIRFTRLIFHLSHHKQILFNDIRKFGRIFLSRDSDLGTRFSNLGLEPLSPEFTFTAFDKLLGQNTRKIKAFLLDQSKIAGLGNIYVDETLFASKIHPETPVKEISQAKRQALHRNIQKILQEAIKKRGTSSRNYVDSFARTGNYQNFLKVYGKKGQPCVNCGSKIKRTVVAQRGTHYCPKCQKK
ncbi:MAG: DNA-formamidopyrimidine glycosylase [Candidatus Gracilibacteria bacterium]|nr:DNA-formamidopyrimidine glycosylase [Candidatus Gracilibacteria bacterium]